MVWDGVPGEGVGERSTVRLMLALAEADGEGERGPVSVRVKVRVGLRQTEGVMVSEKVVLGVSVVWVMEGLWDGAVGVGVRICELVTVRVGL